MAARRLRSSASTARLLRTNLADLERRRQSMPRKSFEIPPVKHNAPIPMASRIGNFLYTSGVMGADPATGQLPSTVEEQAANCFKNQATVLEKAGAKPSDV